MRNRFLGLLLAGAMLAVVSIPACKETTVQKKASAPGKVDTSSFTTAEQWMNFLTTSRDEGQWRDAARALAKFPPAELKKYEQDLRAMMQKAASQDTKRALQAVLKKIK